MDNSRKIIFTSQKSVKKLLDDKEGIVLKQNDYLYVLPHKINENNHRFLTMFDDIFLNKDFYKVCCILIFECNSFFKLDGDYYYCDDSSFIIVNDFVNEYLNLFYKSDDKYRFEEELNKLYFEIIKIYSSKNIYSHYLTHRVIMKNVKINKNLLIVKIV